MRIDRKTYLALPLATILPSLIAILGCLVWSLLTPDRLRAPAIAEAALAPALLVLLMGPISWLIGHYYFRAAGLLQRAMIGASLNVIPMLLIAVQFALAPRS